MTLPGVETFPVESIGEFETYTNMGTTNNSFVLPSYAEISKQKQSINRISAAEVSESTFIDDDTNRAVRAQSAVFEVGS